HRGARARDARQHRLALVLAPARRQLPGAADPGRRRARRPRAPRRRVPAAEPPARAAARARFPTAGDLRRQEARRAPRARGRTRDLRTTARCGAPGAFGKLQDVETASRFQRLGGEAAVEAAVVSFYERVMADPALSPFFEHLDMGAQIKKQIAFMTMAF